MGKLTDAFLAGLGLATRAKKRFFKVYDQLVKEGKAAQAQSDFLKQHWIRINKLQDRFERICLNVAERANLVTRDQFEHLNKKIDKLLKQKKSG